MRFVWIVCMLLAVAPAQAQLTGTASLKTNKPANSRKAASTRASLAVPVTADTFEGPMIGYAARADGSGVYALQGLPGAAFPGPRLSLARAGGPPVVSSVGGYAVARGEDPGQLLIYTLRAKTNTGMLLPRSFRTGSDADRIAVSPLGRAVLLYDRERRQIEVLAGLPGQPFSVFTASLGALPGVLTALAVSDDGAVALAAFSREDGGEIYRLQRDVPAASAASVSRVVHLSFIPQTRNALAADYDRAQVLMLKDAGRQGTQILANRTDGVESPLAVEAVAGGSVFVVNEGSGELVVIPSGQSSPVLFACGCTPATLQRLKDPDSFRLTAGGGVQAVLQADQNLNVFYIPAGEEAAQEPSDSLTPRRVRK